MMKQSEGAAPEEDDWVLVNLEPAPGMLAQTARSVNETVVSTWRGFLLTDWSATARDTAVSLSLQRLFLNPLVSAGLSGLFSFWCSDQLSRRNASLVRANVDLERRLREAQLNLEKLQEALLANMPGEVFDEVRVNGQDVQFIRRGRRPPSPTQTADEMLKEVFAEDEPTVRDPLKVRSHLT